MEFILLALIPILLFVAWQMRRLWTLHAPELIEIQQRVATDTELLAMARALTVEISVRGVEHKQQTTALSDRIDELEERIAKLERKKH